MSNKFIRSITQLKSQFPLITKIFSEMLLFFLAIAPCVPLFHVGHNFYVDWTNHTWMISYFAEHYRAHGSAPFVLNTFENIGMPFPLFYGYLLYPLVGWFSQTLGAGVVVRLFAVLFYTLQFIALHQCLARLKCPKVLQWAIVLFVSWAIYPMTNLYNRSALTEFYATVLVTTGFSWMLCGFLEKTEAKKTFFLLLSVIMLTFAAGFHPITAVMSFFFFIVMIPLFLRILPQNISALPKSLTLTLLTSIVAGVMTLAPWVYVLVLFKKKVIISGVIGYLIYHGSALDGILTRLWPLPYDSRTLRHHLEDVSTPYLDAQISLPLFITAIVLWVLLRKRAKKEDRFLGIPLYIAVFLLVFSSYGHWIPFLTKKFAIIQTAYRLVTYVNLCALAGIFLCLARLKQVNTTLAVSQRFREFLLVGVTLTTLGLMVKWEHAETIAHSGGWDLVGPGRALSSKRVHLPETFYGLYDYVTPGEISQLKTPQKRKAVEFSVLHGNRFGTVPPLEISLKEPTPIETNIQIFPWNHLYLNGQKLEPPLLGAATSGLKYAALLPAGRHHLEYRFEAPQTFQSLRHLQEIGYFLMLVLFLISGARCLQRVWLESK